MEWWHKIEAWGAKHPVMLGIGIFIIGAIILYLFVGGSKAAPAPVQQDLTGSYLTAQAQATQAGNDYAAAQAYMQAETSKSKDLLTASQGHDAAQVTVAGIAQQTYLGLAGIQASTDQLAIGTQGQVDMLGSTLAAQVAQAGYDADIKRAAIASTTTLGQASYDYLTAMGLYQSQTDQTSILAARDTSRYAYDYYGTRDVAYYADQTAKAGYARDISGQYYADQTARSGQYYADQTAQAGYARDAAGYYYDAQTAQAGYTAQTQRDNIAASTYLSSQALALYPSIQGTGFQIQSPTGGLTSISRSYY